MKNIDILGIWLWVAIILALVFIVGIVRTEGDFGHRMHENSCNDNVVEIDGKKYKLIEE